jgi:glucosamine-6-phosphate deaminase
MDIQIYPDATSATVAAADWLCHVVQSHQALNIMLAGGNTPLSLYAEVAQRKLDLQDVHVFALDEYVGVPLDEPRNCANLLRHTAILPWSIPQSQFHALSSLESDAAVAIAAHEAQIANLGGLDLVVLGLGRNGHIGFNEPGSDPDSRGRLLPLSPVSIEANREWFSNDYAPALGVTTGMRTLLESRSILLLAFGQHKADAVAAMTNAPPHPRCPASYLQQHPHAVVILDEAAASLIRR